MRDKDQELEDMLHSLMPLHVCQKCGAVNRKPNIKKVISNEGNSVSYWRCSVCGNKHITNTENLSE